MGLNQTWFSPIVEFEPVRLTDGGLAPPIIYLFLVECAPMVAHVLHRQIMKALSTNDSIQQKQKLEVCWIQINYAMCIVIFQRLQKLDQISVAFQISCHSPPDQVRIVR